MTIYYRLSTYRSDESEQELIVLNAFPLRVGVTFVRVFIVYIVSHMLRMNFFFNDNMTFHQSDQSSSPSPPPLLGLTPSSWMMAYERQ